MSKKHTKSEKLPKKAPSKKVMKLLIREGYVPAPENKPGSHFKYEKLGHTPVIIPKHKTIKEGTLKSILKQAGISRSRFWDIWDDI